MSSKVLLLCLLGWLSATHAMEIKTEEESTEASHEFGALNTLLLVCVVVRTKRPAAHDLTPRLHLGRHSLHLHHVCLSN